MSRCKIVSSLLASALVTGLILVTACNGAPPKGTSMEGAGPALPPAGCIELRKREGPDAC